MLVAEHEVADDREAGILAGPVAGPRGMRLQHAGGDGVERLEHAGDRAGGERRDLELACAELVDVGAEVLERLVGELGGAPHRLHLPFGRLLRQNDRRRGGSRGCRRLDESATLHGCPLLDVSTARTARPARRSLRWRQSIY